MVKEEIELLACVDINGEVTGEYVNRDDFYKGKCLNESAFKIRYAC